MTGELLNRSCRRALHRQVRAERVPQNMHALLNASDPLSATHRFDHAIARDRRSIRQAQHPLGLQVPNGLECGRQRRPSLAADVTARPWAR